MTANVFRVVWTPGSDELLGVCHCGAEHLANDPIEIWWWLLAHPEGHEEYGRGVDVRPRLTAGATR